MNNFKMIIFLMFAANVFAAQYELSCAGSGKLKKEKLNIVIEYNFISPNAYEEYFAGFLTNRLISSGHTIIERRGLASVINELKMDLSGVTKDSVTESKVKDNQFLGKNDVKKIGELLGADAILFFSAWENKCCTFRLVDCQTSEIFISGEITKITEGDYKDKKHRDFAIISTYAISDLINLITSGKNN